MSMYPIATYTVPAGGVSSITFTSINQNFTHLQMRCTLQSNRATYGIDNANLRFNSDSGTNYSYHTMYGNGSSFLTSYSATVAQILLQDIGTSTGGTYSTTIIDIPDYKNTNKFKTTKTFSGNDFNGAIAGYYGTIGLYSGNWRSTSAISTITLTPAAGTLFTQYSRIDLYGIGTTA